jgi:hypothetical protein
MAWKKLDRDALKRILIQNWMIHDGLWYNEVASQFGMGEASPMNVRVCRKLGSIEFSQLMKMAGASSPRNMDEFQELLELGTDVFVPEFQTVKVEYPGDDTQVFRMVECFAQKAMERAGLLPEYECGIFERIEGWFDAMGLKYTRTPDLSRCLRFKGQECVITVKFSF